MAWWLMISEVSQPSASMEEWAVIERSCVSRVVLWSRPHRLVRWWRLECSDNCTYQTEQPWQAVILGSGEQEALVSAWDEYWWHCKAQDQRRAKLIHRKTKIETRSSQHVRSFTVIPVLARG